MEALLVLIGLAILALPVSVIVLFVQISGLSRRVRQLELQQASRGEAPAAPQPVAPARPRPLPAPPPPQSILPQPPRPEPALAPAVRAAPAVPDPDDGQNRPLVIRPDRFAALAVWLRDNWVYAVAAMSLALAGVFFVQYGVENGLLPPRARVMAALAFGVGLVGLGEWLRRRFGDEGETATRYLPSVFSGAGVVTLFAATLAARHLYGLIGPEVTFAGLVAIAVLAVILGWFSGALLSAIGLLGAAAAPFVVAGGSEAAGWLYGYFLIVAALGLAVDSLRRWAWVSVLALALGFGGMALSRLAGAPAEGLIAGLLALVLAAVILPERRLIPRHDGPAVIPALVALKAGPWPAFPVRISFGSLVAATLGLMLVGTGAAQPGVLALAGLAGLALAFLLWADGAPGLDDHAAIPALGFLGLLAAQGADRMAPMAEFAAQAIALRPPETAAPLTVSLILAMAALVSLAALWRALRPGPMALPFGFGAVLVAPLATAGLELLWQPAPVLGNYPWALHVIAVAALMVAFALRLARADAPDLRRAAHATLSALALISLALFILTTKTALTLALAVQVGVAAALDRRFRLPEMSLFIQAGVAVLGWRLLVDPGLGWALEAALGQVLLAYGGTLAALVATLWLLRPLERPMARAVVESASAGLAALLVNVLITRWLTQGDDGHRLETHWGLALNALPWVVLMLMQLYRAQVGGWLRRLRLALAGLGALLGLGGLAVAATSGNPLFTYSPDQPGALVRGPLGLDTLALAYTLPGLLLLAAAWKQPGLARWHRLGLTGIGAALAVLYLGLEIRRVWQGDWLGVPGTSQGELYSYTLAMMLIGAGLLYQAIARRSDLLRRIALGVIGLTAAKVFLVDASGLTGLTRVVSFAGLGLSLAGLAWLNRWAGSRA